MTQTVFPSPGGALRDAISRRQAQVGVIGLGYVGLPLARTVCQAGFTVTGFDSDPEKISRLKSNRTYIRHIPDSDIAEMNGSGRFSGADDFDALAAMDVIVICVPTPLTDDRCPDMTAVTATAEAIAARLRPGQLIVLESSTWPGTTDELVKPILEKSGLSAGRDFHLAYAPEREDPGSGAGNIPRVVGADGDTARDLAEAFYRLLVDEVVTVSDSRTAEAVKLTENVFRSVNIALVNELKMVYAAMGIDVREVIAAAATKPFGYMPFHPGPGLGGHCIPVDPFYLAWKAREYGVPTRFVELAGEINTAMPRYVVSRLADALADDGVALEGAKILLLGMAYKKDVDDTRESPALELIALLETHGAIAAYHDPFIAEIPKTRKHGGLAGRGSVPLTPESLSAHDAVLIVTDHTDVDYAMVSRHARLVVDTRNAATAVSGGARIVPA